MKIPVRFLVPYSVVIASLLSAQAQTTFTLNPLNSFGTGASGTNIAGSIQPGETIGISPINGNTVTVSAQGFGVQPGDVQQSTNGFNMRGIAYDSVSRNLVFVDTHAGSSGNLGAVMPTNSDIYILDRGTGQIIGGLATNGIVGGGGVGAVAAVGVADDGVVYVANQINAGASTPFKIYRWPSADATNDLYFTNSPYGRLSSSAAVVAFSNSVSPPERIGQTLAVRGAGTNTEIIIGTAGGAVGGTAGPGTNVFLFTTTDGTNFSIHRMYFPGITGANNFNDGIAWGVSNTFWTKQVGQPLYFLSYDPVNFTNNSVIATYAGASPTDPLLNLSAIAVDTTNHLLAGLEEIGGNATGGQGKVWLFDIPFPSNTPPAVLDSRIYVPNFTKATAPMGYLTFGNGSIYANVVNNGLLASTVDSAPLGPPSFTQDLPATTRALSNAVAHFEVHAITDVTNYQWYSNNVVIAGATTYFLNLPSVQPAMSGIVFKVVVANAAGTATSANSTLTVLNPADFFHLDTLWTKIATNLALTDLSTSTSNYMTSGGGSGTPNERTIAYNALSNQLLIVRGPSAFGNLRIFAVDADSGTFQYLLKTNGIATSQTLALCGIGVGDDGAVYAASVSASDTSFKIYRWPDSGSNTLPQLIFGTASSAGTANPIQDQTGGGIFRFGDTLAVHGAGLDTEIVVDSQNSSKYAAVLHPTDTTMTNWVSTGYLLQNLLGSYGSEAYGTVIGRSLQFGPVMSTIAGSQPTFWQKRYNTAAGAPLAGMGYTVGASGISPLAVANSSLPLFTNGAVGINFSLKLAAAVNFVGAIGSDNNNFSDLLTYYDVTDPAQALLLDQKPLPGGVGALHKANGNAVAQVIFGANPITGTNYIFVVNGNNCLAAYVLAGGAIPPPQFLVQPRNLRVLEGTAASMTAVADQVVTIAWYKGTNSPVDTGVRGSTFAIANATGSSAGDYFAIGANINGSVTTRVAHVSIGLTNDNYTLSQIWAAAGPNTSVQYVTSTGGPNTPGERSFAYNALSNQLIIVKCPPASTAYTNWVVDAATGNLLYTLNTATGIIHMGPSEVTGSNPIDLVGAAAADDGAIYIASESPNASGGVAGDATKMMHIYRWADSGPTTAPTLIFEGDPSGQPPGANLRWGDSIAARGSNVNTELFLNAFEGTYAAILTPTNSSMLGFSNYLFADIAGGGSIGRSLQFGPTNTVFEKRKGGSLYFSRYTLTNQSSALLLNIDSSTTLGGVAVDTLHNLAMGVDFIGSSATKPDAVALYDISEPGSPMLIADYSFPSNQVANANAICQTIVVSNRVYALDANNGLISFIINPPVNSMILHVSNSPPNITLRWGNQFAVLQGTPSLAPPNWTDLTVPGVTNSVQAGTTNQFYRLLQRR